MANAVGYQPLVLRPYSIRMASSDGLVCRLKVTVDFFTRISAVFWIHSEYLCQSKFEWLAFVH